MKTFFFVIATKFRVNFILRTDIFRLLKKQGHRIVIITPFFQDSSFIKEFGGGNVFFEPLPQTSRFFIALDNLRSKALAINHPVINFARQVHFHKTHAYRTAGPFIVFIKEVINKIILSVFSPFRSSPKFWDFLERNFVYSSGHLRLFRKYQPAGVILASAGAERNDILFIVYAKKFRATQFAVDNNIDVFEFRYFFLPREITGWMLFGQQEKSDALALQRIPEKELIVTGPARYDHYFRPESWRLSRSEFFAHIGADPDKKLITYAAKGPKLYPFNADIIQALLAAIKCGILGDAQVLVRFDPLHDPYQYGDLLKQVLWETVDGRGDQKHVANLLYHSDAVLSPGSTFNIEACLVGTPSVWISFDGFLLERVDRRTSYRRTFELQLFKGILSTGAISLAETPEAMISLLQQYLADRNINEDKRERLITSYYADTDGQAGIRIATEILKRTP